VLKGARLIVRFTPLNFQKGDRNCQRTGVYNSILYIALKKPEPWSDVLMEGPPVEQAATVFFGKDSTHLVMPNNPTNRFPEKNKR
jgi:hypothetical protein